MSEEEEYTETASLEDFREAGGEEEVEVFDIVRGDSKVFEREAKLARLRSLPEEEKMFQIWDAKVKGVPLRSISNAYGITITETLDAIKKVGEVYREELLNLDAISILASNIQWLDEMERVALFEAHQLETQVVKNIDPMTGKVTEDRIVDPNRSKFFQSALKAREMKIKLMADHGILPTDKNPESLFRRISDFSGDKIEEVAERTEKEILESMDKLMKFGRLMPPASQDAGKIKKKEQEDEPDSVDGGLEE